jgi:CubicO group peptidase (beta-lactamase class C family)
MGLLGPRWRAAWTKSTRETSDPLKAIVARTAETLSRHLATGYMPGAVALIGQADTADVVAVGTPSKDDVTHIRRDSIFRIASMTKPLTAAATMILVEAGRLRLDEPVSRWLPELANRRVLKNRCGPLDDTIPAKRAITVEDLLTFRCGLGIVLTSPDNCPILGRISELKLVGFGPPDPTSPLAPDEWLKRLGTLPLMTQPGEQWMYNTGSYLLGVLLARASGRLLPELLRGLIFEPLGMRDTGFFVPASKRGRLVSAYRLEAGHTELYDAPASSAWSTPPTFPDGGGGLVSTADDYFVFSRFLLARGWVGKGRLISEASVAAMTRDHLTAEQRAGGAPILSSGRGWGFGLSVVTEQTAEALPVGAYGWTGGLGTSWMADPRSGLTAILLTQTLFTSPVAPAVHQEFWRAVFSPALL